MAWPYEQNFDGLSTGTLGGQDSWQGSDADQQVVSSVAQTGSQSVRMDGIVQAGTSYRDITASTTGTVYFAWRWSVNGGAGDMGRFLITDSGAANRAVNLKAVDKTGTTTFQYKNGGTWTDYFTPTVNTWYIIEVTYDSSADDYDIRYKAEGGSYDAGVTGISYDQTSGDIERLAITNDAGNSTFYDSFSASDPDTGGPAAVTVAPTLTLLNVG